MIGKTDFIEKVALKTGKSQKDVKAVLDASIDVVSELLKAGEEVNITGFGKFYVSKREGRKGRNPQTGETIEIPPMKIPAFKAGKSFKESIK